jgi:hypothetical protein
MADNIENKKSQNTEESTWWNRPLIGNKSMVQRVKSLLNVETLKSFSQEEVPDATIELYKNLYGQLRNVSAIAKTIDNEKFTGREFITFLMINDQVSKDAGDYKGLKHSIELLRAALETKDSFLKIEATETRYRGYAQQEFYDYIFDLLEQNIQGEKFKELAQKQLLEVIPRIKTDEGKIAVQSYVNQLEILAENELGLQLLFLFKQNDLSNFALLKTVAQIADSFYDKNLINIKDFMIIVQVNADLLLKLGNIIQVPQAKNIPETYGLILQYIALRNRHRNAYGQFQQLIILLKDWEKLYNPLISVRKQYSSEGYKHPKLFEEEIPGLSIYEKYQQHLNS